MNPARNRLLVVLVVILVVVAVDQITKHLVTTAVAPGDEVEPIPVLADFFQIVHSTNTGAAFGIFQNAGDFFLGLAIVVVIGLLYYYPRIPANAALMRFATGLVCGGAIGNAVDRILRGHVTDFIHYQIPGLISNVSNLADHAIVLGVFLIIFENWRFERAEKRQQNAEPTPETGPS